MEYLEYLPYTVLLLIVIYIGARLATRAYFNSRIDYEKEEKKNE